MSAFATLNLRAAQSEGFLSAERQFALITDVQNVPSETVTDDDGTTRTVYGKTAASEAALETLTAAFLPAIEHAARKSKVQDEDALGVVLEEFVSALRRHDLTSDRSFAANIATILTRKVSDTDRTADVITVKENAAAKYWRLLHEHNDDVSAAYAECRDTSNWFDPATFLAVHHAIGLQSLDALWTPADRGMDDRSVNAATRAKDPERTQMVNSPEDHVLAEDYVRWLFTLVSDEQEAILRLYFGFEDDVTEAARLDHGYRVGELLDDKQIGGVLGLSRPGVQRRRTSAISTMHAEAKRAEDAS